MRWIRPEERTENRKRKTENGPESLSEKLLRPGDSNLPIPSSVFRSPFSVLLSAAVTFLLMLTGQAQDADEFFRQNCFSCHTIGGGRITGPDLKDVESRQDRAWLTGFITNPQAVINSGDAYAAKLVSDARGVIMPRLPAMNQDLAIALLDLIGQEGLLEESQFLGLQISDQPFTQAQVRAGEAIFLGPARLQNGGASCISCHAVSGVGTLGGGQLGPDLTRVYERLGGRQALAAWMLAPATETMRPLFVGRPMTQDEILSLVAFLEDSSLSPGEADAAAARMNFFLLGLGGTVLSLAAFGTLWRGRFRTVRRAMLERNLERGEQ